MCADELVIHLRVAGAGGDDVAANRLADVFTFRDGKAIGYRTFGEVKEALAWAGVDPANPT